MDKKQLCEVLEACLLHQDNLSDQEIIERGVNPEYTQIGIKLNQFLQEKLK